MHHSKRMTIVFWHEWTITVNRKRHKIDSQTTKTKAYSLHRCHFVQASYNPASQRLDWARGSHRTPIAQLYSCRSVYSLLRPVCLLAVVLSPATTYHQLLLLYLCCSHWQHSEYLYSHKLIKNNKKNEKKNEKKNITIMSNKCRCHPHTKQIPNRSMCLLAHNRRNIFILIRSTSSFDE